MFSKQNGRGSKREETPRNYRGNKEVSVQRERKGEARTLGCIGGKLLLFIWAVSIECFFALHLKG